MSEAKPWWASKTLWANFVAFLAAITGVFGIDLGLDPEAQSAIVSGIMAMVNIVLRLLTRTPVALASSTGIAKCAAWASALAVFLLLAACAGTAETRATNALAITCDSYAKILDQLTPLRAAGKLTDAQVGRVDAANVLVDPFCSTDAIVDPATAVVAVKNGLALLTAIKELL